MLLDEALKLSSIRVAVRPVIINLRLQRSLRVRKQLEREMRVWEQPAVAARNLIKFHHQTHEPVYCTYTWTKSGQARPLVLERRNPNDDWEPLDPSDTVTALGDLLTRVQIEARQRRIIERKDLLGLAEGREWSCQWLHEVLADPEGVANTERAHRERELAFRRTRPGKR